jgi:zinc/manganese transport system substrate-binding protein
MLRLVAIAVFGALFATPIPAEARLNVVASFSILGDLVKNVGGDTVSVTTLVGPNGDVHVYTPTPDDARRVADARLLVVNGLALEGWLPRLLQSSGSKATIVIASKGVTPLQAGSGADPHAWQSVANAKVYIGNIRDALIAADAADTGTFRANAARYLAELDKLDAEVRTAVAKIPPERRKVISTHDAFGYFAKAYGIEFLAPEGVSTETEPSARDLAAIITQVKTGNIPAVFLENMSDPRLIQQVASETGAKVGGTLFSDALTDEKGDAPTYIALVRHNIKALSSALGN